VLHALAYTGFMLNLINMIPVSILDGGAVFRAARFLWHGGGRNKALAIYGLYALTAVALILGMRAAYIVQHRL
jgi:Zn-dependent protease